MKHRKSVASVALAVAMSLTRSVLADSTVYSSISGSTTTVYDYTDPSTSSSGGIGDDYTTSANNSDYITVTGMSFYGGLSRYNDYLSIKFYGLNNRLVASVAPSAAESQGIGLHTLSAGDFNLQGSQLLLPANGYVVFSPITYTSVNVNTGVTIPADTLPPVFALGFGQIPTIGSNNASSSVLLDPTAGLSFGAYASATNQFAQFSITGIPSNPGASNGSGNSAVWSSSTSGDWEVAGNWQVGIPTGAGQNAAFADSIGSGSATISLTANETVGNVIFNGSSGGSYTITSNGNPSLTLNNNGSPAVISVNAGLQTISAPISLVSGLNINTTWGSLKIGGTVTGTGPVTVNSSSSLVMAPTGILALGLVDNGLVSFAAQSAGSTILSHSVPGIVLNAGSTLALAATPTGVGRQVLVVSGSTQVGNPANSILALSVSGGTGAWTSTIDLANNDLIIPDAAPQFLPTITDQVTQGFNSGNWQGSGGILSSAAAANSSHLTALGVIRNDDGTGHVLYGSFDGVTTSDFDILVKYTYYGDANLDGKVDGSDYSRIDAAYLAGGSATGWFNGDFNYDGTIDGSDYTLIDNAFNRQGAQFTAQIAYSTAQLADRGATSVPEPATLSLIGLASIQCLARRRVRPRLLTMI